ncbi:MAG: hypothetical protein C0594_05645 [Marinilabiliales bacterium]|nr:MAG: hypothetical protein C0594_05645 [Marinilabiliales bacterium]
MKKKEKEAIKNWYYQLADSMVEEGVEKTGHIQEVKTIIDRLQALHEFLMENQEEIQYQELYNWAEPNLIDFAAKARLSVSGNMEIALNALYSQLLLRLQNKELTEETKHAFSTISKFIAVLSKKFHDMESGNMDFQ